MKRDLQICPDSGAAVGTDSKRPFNGAQGRSDSGAPVRMDSKLAFNAAERIALAMLAAMAVSVPMAAQVKPNATSADVAGYSAPDRAQKLAEGAKQEGELNIYTSAQSDDMGALVAAFEKKYGVKVNVWRSSSEKVLQRAVTEARAGRHTMDVAETNGPELESMHREKLLEAVNSPYLGDLIAPAIRPHGEWVGTRLNVFVQAYNTSLVKKDELPKTWEDLANPKWKGKLGIEQEDSDWLAGQYAELGEAKAGKVFRDIVAANGVSVRKGHTLLTQLVVSGEIPLALTVYNYKAEQLKQKGAPIDWFHIGPAIARPNGVAVAKKAPHPHAAVLFYDFEISPEGQKILAGRDFVPTSKKVDTPLNKIPMKFVDARIALDEFQKWEKLYEELFTRKAK
jgi:iron(III) transport system substrate-binding protein